MRKPFVIAEIGLNANGSVDFAKKLIDTAKACDCDAVKFQKRTIDKVYSEDMLRQQRESPWGTTQKHQKEGLEFGQKEYDAIDKYCKKVDIPWFASAWDMDSLEFLKRYDLPFNKIASPMLSNHALCASVAGAGKHTFISTGMSTFEQIDRVVAMFKRSKTPFTLMHCVSIYPCPDMHCNIKMIRILKGKYQCSVGYSGHEVGLLPSVLAVKEGAEAIERHITFDRSLYGTDQSASLERRGLEYLVRDIRDVEAMMGDGKKTIHPKEAENAKKLRYWEATWNE